MNQKIPLLLFSDAPDGVTGLGRITRDLAIHLYQDPDTSEKFEVGTYGYLATGSRGLPWPQYCSDAAESVTPRLRKVWEDFSQGRDGILMPIMPPSWILGLTNPSYVGQELPANDPLQSLVKWLETKPFEIWPYLAVESCGAGMKFGTATKRVIENSDRPLFYNGWGAELARLASQSRASEEWIHHGINTSIFTPQPEKAKDFRSQLGVDDDTLLLGCVATNTKRKQLGLLFEVSSLLRERLKGKFRLWLHTDKPINHWSIPQLTMDFGFSDEDFTLTYTCADATDFWLANFYSACNLTFLPTHGEGFGYPVIESLACGTPCVTGSFGGQAEIAEGRHILEPVGYQVDGIHGLLQPIYSPKDAADRIEACFITKDGVNVERARQWDWKVQWPKFKDWFLND